MEIKYYKTLNGDAEEELHGSISQLPKKKKEQIPKKLTYLESKSIQENRKAEDLVKIIIVKEKLLELKIRTFVPYRLISMVDINDHNGILVLDFIVKKFEGALRKRDLARAINRYYNVINK